MSHTPKNPRDEQHPNNHEKSANQRTVNGRVHISGSVEVDAINNLRTDNAAARGEEQTQRNKELFWTRLTFLAVIAYTTITLLMYFANYKAAIAAKTQAETTSKELEIAHRPWVFVSEIHPDGDFTWSHSGNQLSGSQMGVAYTLKNSGNTAATQVFFWALMYYISPKDINGSLKQLANNCHSIDSQQMRDAGTTLFPDAIGSDNIGAGGQVPGPSQEAGPYLLSCVIYSSTFSNTRYSTGTVYSVQQAMPDHPGFRGSLNTGYDVPKERLVLTPAEFGAVAY